MIPVGSLYQVFNVLDCIHVELDFVSPEHINNCLDVTNDFRIHSEKEDKLQIKNITYFSILNALHGIDEKNSSKLMNLLELKTSSSIQ